MPGGLAELLWLVGKLGAVLAVVLLLAAYVVLAERKLLGRMQVRLGPNRAGPGGVLQPLADLLKMSLKEDTVPEGADGLMFRIAPGLSAATALLLFAVVPFGPPVRLFGRELALQISDLEVGVLYVLALSSLGVYGVVLGGWASRSKYALLGSVRAAAQMVSYELALGLSLVPVAMLARSFRLSEIVEAQAAVPFAVLQPVSLGLFAVASLAETRRVPFDLPEADNELGAGFHTEYSGLRFGLFFLGEYVNMIVLGGLTATFFFAGWRGPVLPPLVWFALKVTLVLFVLIWIRATLPRLRYDQLMALGWKALVPLALLNIVATGAVCLALEGAR